MRVAGHAEEMNTTAAILSSMSSLGTPCCPFTCASMQSLCVQPRHTKLSLHPKHPSGILQDTVLLSICTYVGSGLLLEDFPVSAGAILLRQPK